MLLVPLLAFRLHECCSTFRPPDNFHWASFIMDLEPETRSHT